MATKTQTQQPEKKILSVQEKGFWSRLAHRRIRLLRLSVQISSFIILNAGIFGVARTFIPLPISQPTGAPFSIVWGGFEAIEYALTNSILPFFALGVFMISAVLVGRAGCGWVCPMGLYQRSVGAVPTKKAKISKPDNKDLNGIGGFLMALFLLLAFGIGFMNLTNLGSAFMGMPFTPFDPSATLFGSIFYYSNFGNSPPGVGMGFIGDVFSLYSFMFIFRILIFFLITLLVMYVPQGYCRWFCPTGALMGYFSKNSILGISRDPVRCTNCGDCETACPMGVPILDYSHKKVTDSMCTNCGDCIDACNYNAINFSLNF